MNWEEGKDLGQLRLARDRIPPPGWVRMLAAAVLGIMLVPLAALATAVALLELKISTPGTQAVQKEASKSAYSVVRARHILFWSGMGGDSLAHIFMTRPHRIIGFVAGLA